MHATEWSYISGLVTVLSDRLIDRRTLLGLLDAADAEERRGRLRGSYLYEDTVPGERPGEEIDVRFAQAVEEIAKQSPDPRIARIFLLEREWTTYRRFVKRELTEKHQPGEASKASGPRDELYRSLLIGEAPEPEWRRFAAVGDVMADRAKKEKDPRGEMDRAADAAEAASILDAAKDLGSELLTHWTRTWMNLRAATALIRARLNGWDAEAYYHDWREFGFDEPALADLAHESESAWPGALMRIGMKSSDADTAKESPALLAHRVNDCVTEMLKDAAGIPFGPERVFAFLWLLRNEATNLRIVLSAAESGMPKELVEKELRTEP
jgi:hypothetical protein